MSTKLSLILSLNYEGEKSKELTELDQRQKLAPRFVHYHRRLKRMYTLLLCLFVNLVVFNIASSSSKQNSFPRIIKRLLLAILVPSALSENLIRFFVVLLWKLIDAVCCHVNPLECVWVTRSEVLGYRAADSLNRSIFRRWLFVRNIAEQLIANIDRALFQVNNRSQ